MKRFKVIWDDEAIKNYNEIWMYIAKDSVHYADKVSEEIEDSIERLISNPFLGPEEEILKRFN